MEQCVQYFIQTAQKRETSEKKWTFLLKLGFFREIVLFPKGASLYGTLFSRVKLEGVSGFPHARAPFSWKAWGVMPVCCWNI